MTPVRNTRRQRCQNVSDIEMNYRVRHGHVALCECVQTKSSILPPKVAMDFLLLRYAYFWRAFSVRLKIIIYVRITPLPTKCVITNMDLTWATTLITFFHSGELETLPFLKLCSFDAGTDIQTYLSLEIQYYQTQEYFSCPTQ